MAGQFALRQKGNVKCIRHQEDLKLLCNTCQDLACIECVTSDHDGHNFRHLKDIAPVAKEEIKSFIDYTENIALPNIRQGITSAKDILKKDTAHFDDLEKNITHQLEKLKQDLELLSADIISSYRKLRTENSELITNYIKAFETRQEEFNRCLRECKEVLQKGSHVNIYDVRNEIKSRESLLPPFPTLNSASFIRNKEPVDYLRKSFGIVDIGQHICGAQVHVEGSVGQHQSTSESTPIYSAQIKPTYNILTNTKVMAEFEPPCQISALCPANDGDVYTLCDKTVTQFNKAGEVQQKIRYNVRISDVRVSSTTQHIWTCSDEDWTVMECEPSISPLVRFKTETKPTCLCVTGDNCILIGMSKQITKYTTKGKVLLTNKPYLFGQPIVRSPWRITECSVTHNVAVVDLDNKFDGGDDKPYVLVMDRNLQEIFRYRGDIPTKYQQNMKWGYMTFEPRDVRYDSKGKLVISDCGKKCVHLLSGGGDYLKPIHNGDVGVYSVSIGINNTLWVVTWSISKGYKVKLLL